MSCRNIIVSLVIVTSLSLAAVAGLFIPYAAAESQQAVKKSAVESLPGYWGRTDGGYILELKEPGMDGTLKAAYFNPRPINVSRAEWKRKDGKISLFVELRDINYPGSQYSLTYDPDRDRLAGTYYQAVQKETFPVEFMRRK